MRVGLWQLTLHLRANNGALMTPTLILTRPAGQSESFAAEIAALWDRPLRIIQSPLLEILFLPTKLTQPDAVIFTSANGVAAAKAMALPQGLRAWCVGAKTGQIAQEAGFDPVVGPGDADGLVSDVIAANPLGSLAHIRGRYARGDVAARLNAAGLRCADVVAYDQRPLPLTHEAQEALLGGEPVVFPVFSPRTATILNQQGPFAAPVVVVAISDAVKKAVEPALFAAVWVAKTPDRAAMAAETCAVLRRLVQR